MLLFDPLSVVFPKRAARSVLFLLLVALVGSLFATLPAVGQGISEDIVEKLQDSYEVLELSDGWLLQPKDDRGDFRAIEIRGGKVAVDGEWVDESELKRFVDADASLIFDLAEGREPAVAASSEPTSEPASEPTSDPSSAPISASDTAADRPEPPDAPRPPRPTPPVRDELRVNELERVREQLEDAIERARSGEIDRELRDRLEELRDLDDRPREIERLQRELDRLIERGERRTTRRGRDAQVTLGSNLVVERDEKVSEAVVISGNLDVLGEIDGDTTVVFGDARVDGFIDGTLVVVGGNIDVGRKGEIDGDAIAVGGAVRTEAGGHIDGEVIHLDFGELMLGDVRIGEFHWPRFDLFHFEVFDAIGRVFRILFLAVLALLAYVLAGAKVEEVSGWVRSAPWRSLFSGLAVEIGFLPALVIVVVLLCVSVIGILVACFVPPLAIFALMVIFLLGYTSVALSIGDWIARRFGLEYGNRYLVILLGMAFIEIWSVLGDVVGLIPFFGWIAALILFTAWCFKFVVWTVGLGAAVLCQFSRGPASPGGDWQQLPPTPPPPAPAASGFEPGGYGAGADSGFGKSYDESEFEQDALDGEAESGEDREYPLLQQDDIPEESSPDEAESEDADEAGDDATADADGDSDDADDADDADDSDDAGKKN